MAEGQNCKANIPGNRIVGFSKCSWPRRLEQLVNNLVGGPLIKIYNGARGGANSQVGRALLHYLPPHGDSYYDLIINAHSVNDQHVLTMIEAGLYNTSLAGYQLAMAENFTRAVMASEENTILIWLEDYLGNEQRSILDLQDYFSKTIHLLSNYYGFGVVSYSNAVRDIVYGDTTASALTPVWYNSQKEMKREVHPGIIMHACTTYILLYYMRNMLLQACAVSGNDQATTLSYNSTLADLVTKANGHTQNGHNRYPKASHHV